MESAQKIGYGLITLSVVLMVIGSVGYTVEGDVEEVPRSEERRVGKECSQIGRAHV